MFYLFNFLTRSGHMDKFRILLLLLLYVFLSAQCFIVSHNHKGIFLSVWSLRQKLCQKFDVDSYFFQYVFEIDFKKTVDT